MAPSETLACEEAEKETRVNNGLPRSVEWPAKAGALCSSYVQCQPALALRALRARGEHAAS